MNNIFLSTAALGLILLAPSLTFAADGSASADTAFVAKVSEGGLFEAMAGDLAGIQAWSQDVKDQGITEAHDHKEVNDKLSSIAGEANIPVAQKLNPMFQKQLDDLKVMSGTAFDKAYLADMEAVHDKDGAAFAHEAKTGANPELRKFAAETHRIVERHIGELRAVGPESTD